MHHPRIHPHHPLIRLSRRNIRPNPPNIRHRHRSTNHQVSLVLSLRLPHRTLSLSSSLTGSQSAYSSSLSPTSPQYRSVSLPLSSPLLSRSIDAMISVRPLRRIPPRNHRHATGPYLFFFSSSVPSDDRLPLDFSPTSPVYTPNIGSPRYRFVSLTRGEKEGRRRDDRLDLLVRHRLSTVHKVRRHRRSPRPCHRLAPMATRTKKTTTNHIECTTTRTI